MTTIARDSRSTLRGRFVSKRVIHRGACGTWYEAVPAASVNSQSLPTEFAQAHCGAPHRKYLVAREPKPGEVLGTDVVGVTHRHLIAITDAGWMTDDLGRRLFVQTTSSKPQGMACDLTSEQVAVQWRRIVSAVAAALAHLHAFGVTHGAVHLNNIFQDINTWRLGPTMCHRAGKPADDLQALAILIGAELCRMVADPSEESLLARLAELCMVDGVNAAHISVWAEAGLPSECPAFPERVPPIPEAVRTHDGYRITSHSEDAIAFLSCAPHRAPRSGATVPASQLDQLGSTVSMAASGEAEMSLPDQCMVVFGAVVFGGVATIGEPALIDPPRGWGNLHVQMRPEGVAMRWFWPQDLSCRKMRLQVRPDRYPRPNDDDDVSECHRSVYESAGQCLVSVPQHWNRAYVRVGRADSLAEQDAVFGKADRHDSVPGSRARTGSPFLVRFATA